MNRGVDMMRYIDSSDGCTVVTNTVDRTVTLYTMDDEGYKYTTVIPFHEKMTGSDITQRNGRIFIDGFELHCGEWRRTLVALFHYIF